MYNQYKYKFYLNANHSIVIDDRVGEIHPHTWEIVMDALKVVEGFVQFSEVENTVEGFLSKYQDKYINDVDPFDTVNPTLENLCEYINIALGELLLEKGWLILRIEMSETPARSYIIDRVDREID